ncbi:MAG: hypothetical protein HYX68_00710 [Planctomycetes bacterium]|nr:hypothetical protein [Planctomycetota bacterium]
MTRTPVFIAALVCVFFSVAPICESGGEKDGTVGVVESKVRLRLNVIERSKLTERYGLLFDRELNLQDSVQACLKSGDERLPLYQQALQAVQTDQKKIKKRLTVLEAENTQLMKRIGKKNATEISFEELETLNRAIVRVLDRLQKVEKRLDKLEKPR